MFQKTTVEGVFACGDNSGMMRSVANAVASGNVTGAVVNGFLSQAQF
jgi:thioredoxin reductase